VAIPTRGTVILTALGTLGRSVTLTTDPTSYGFVWPKRQAKYRGLGGSVTTQEFGKHARDAVIHLESGTQWLNVDVVRDMDWNDALRGEAWRLQDSEGNDCTVRIETWSPVKARGMPELYEYTLDLEILAIAVLRGQDYTGTVPLAALAWTPPVPPPGPQGPQGSPGAQGPQGASGGGDGEGGGAQGPQGTAGPQGGPGGTGPQGAGGAAGAQGAAGPQGAPGSVGSAGAQGTQGVAGPQGAVGSTGPQGAAGATGAQGALGATGATGPQGPQGAVGAAGPQGDAGATGAQGATGTTGSTGPQGPQGAAGPQGATGAQGTAGPQGAAGAAGSQGDAGATGAQGAAGPQGATGTTGSPGAQGAQGVVGATGPQGAQGAAGATGAQGPQGLTGPQGGAGTTLFSGLTDSIAASQIPSNTVTYAKIQDVSAASKLLGRGSAGGAGDPQEITLGTGLTMTGTTLDHPPVVLTGAGGIVISGADPAITVTTRGYISGASVANGTTVETTLHTWTVPANTLVTDSGLHVVANLQVANNANTKTMKLVVGGTEIVLNTVTTAPANGFLLVDVRIVYVGATSARVFGTVFRSLSGANALERVIGQTALTGIDWTSTTTVKFTGQGAATSDITQIVSTMLAFRAP